MRPSACWPSGVASTRALAATPEAARSGARIDCGCHCGADPRGRDAERPRHRAPVRPNSRHSDPAADLPDFTHSRPVLQAITSCFNQACRPECVAARVRFLAGQLLRKPVVPASEDFPKARILELFDGLERGISAVDKTIRFQQIFRRKVSSSISTHIKPAQVLDEWPVSVMPSPNLDSKPPRSRMYYRNRVLLAKKNSAKPALVKQPKI